MPDPNTHADDMKSPVQTCYMPPFWWLNPWREAKAWRRRAESGYASATRSAEKYVRLAGEKLQIEADNLAARQALSKHFGEVIKSPLTLTANCREAGLLYGHFVRSHDQVSTELADVKRQLADALADKAEADKHHAEEHAANIRLADEIIQLKDEIFWLKHPVKTKTYVKERPAKRKPKAKKKGGRK